MMPQISTPEITTSARPIAISTSEPSILGADGAFAFDHAPSGMAAATSNVWSAPARAILKSWDELLELARGFDRAEAELGQERHHAGAVLVDEEHDDGG